MTITEAKKERRPARKFSDAGALEADAIRFAEIADRIVESEADLGYDPRNPFEVVLSNGDRATAATPEAILVAARTLASDAREGNYYERYTATFLHEGTCVRADVRAESL